MPICFDHLIAARFHGFFFLSESLPPRTAKFLKSLEHANFPLADGGLHVDLKPPPKQNWDMSAKLIHWLSLSYEKSSMSGVD